MLMGIWRENEYRALKIEEKTFYSLLVVPFSSTLFQPKCKPFQQKKRIYQQD
jgi:hypothetical protein